MNPAPTCLDGHVQTSLNVRGMPCSLSCCVTQMIALCILMPCMALVQESCATSGAAVGQCAACGSPADTSAFHPLASNGSLDALARRLGLEDTDTIMTCASNALTLLAYQEQLVSARVRQNDKEQLKKITSQSKVKIRELHGAAQKVCANVWSADLQLVQLIVVETRMLLRSYCTRLRFCK